jgi:hypothetical protein
MNFWQASWNDLVVSTPFEFQQPDPANGNFIQPTRVPPASMLTLDSSVSDILEAPISRPDELFAAGQATGVNTNFLDDHIFYERTATEYGPRLHHTNDAPAEERTSHIPREQNHVFQGNTKCEFPKCRHLSFEDQPEFRYECFPTFLSLY